ncbi:hypothetical protein KIW84_064799 [Lathyrus oleraceus]|uniref:Uncharacterized protein n=1 Tax=Pisum sativum TaxID=3888 RepID=A0A9D5A9K5_PEA|nr:hypothetical protein KIW84_064799 [Pisum sativum]
MQRWRELAAQITPPLEEKEMTKIFLKTPSSFYYERMIVSAPSDFTEMVNMGMRLEEGVREGRLSKDEASTSKRYGSSFSKKKDDEANAISNGRKRRPQIRRNPISRQHHHHQLSSIIPVFSNQQSTPIQQQQHQQQQPQQRTNTYKNNNTNKNHHQQNFERKKVSFDLIPMSYAELYPSLVLKNLIQPRNPPQISEPLPWWYKPELCCTFRQGAPGHDIENCYPLKSVFPKDKEESFVSKKVEVPVAYPFGALKGKSGESSDAKANDDDEVLRLIKRMDQFDHTVANITSCNNLSFCDEELPEEGRNHNLALHNSMNYKEDALSNVLVDIGSSLNMLPKSTI